MCEKEKMKIRRFWGSAFENKKRLLKCQSGCFFLLFLLKFISCFCWHTLTHEAALLRCVWGVCVCVHSVSPPVTYLYCTCITDCYAWNPCDRTKQKQEWDIPPCVGAEHRTQSSELGSNTTSRFPGDSCLPT